MTTPPRPRRLVTIMLTVGCAALLAGCAAGGRAGTGPYEPQREDRRDPALAQRLTQEAAEIAADDPVKAEALLREALTADLYHGPAHNNLGVLYLGQGLNYQAASEFEWARKLLPGHPDPRMNLALTLERAGRIDEAIGTYKTALEVYPDHLPTLQALARAQLMHNRADDTTTAMLDTIAVQGESAAWRDWAKFQRTRVREEGGPQR